MKKLRVTILAAALGMAGGAMAASPAQAVQASPAGSIAGTSASAYSGWDGGWIHQGNDMAYFDFKDGWLSVKDGEKDGHPVYAYLRLRNDMAAQYLYDNTSGGTNYSIGPKSDYKYVTVCEEVWGPDWCHSPVYLR